MVFFLFSVLVTLSAFILLILLHEYGHAWAATRAGLKVEGIEAGNGPAFKFEIGGAVHRIGLIPFSGKCYIPGLNEAPARTRLLIAAAGLVASLAVGLGLCATGVFGNSEVLLLLGKASIGIAAFNLLPIPGFDGWVVLKAYLDRERTT